MISRPCADAGDAGRPSRSQGRPGVGDRDSLVTPTPPAAAGRWHCVVTATPWARFGLYNAYVVVRNDGRAIRIPAHAGELVPGSTEDLLRFLPQIDPVTRRPPAPMTLDLDPTFRCASIDCGGSCFSAPYRRLSPGAMIPTGVADKAIAEFAQRGGAIVRFDGGGDPLLHSAVRDGFLVARASALNLKTSILTSGDLLDRSNLPQYAAAECYVRISLNAATDATRMRFHGNRVPLERVLRSAERLASLLRDRRSETPVGATYLLSPLNAHEVLDAARLAREAGIGHFSVRRVLGPPDLRSQFSPSLLADTLDLFEQVRGLHSPQFRVAVPWRHPAEDDLSPVNGDLGATWCWQSTLKTVLEPDPVHGSARLQLCGRYRGNGIGQLMQLGPLAEIGPTGEWVESWLGGFTRFSVSRRDLPRTCLSCIDRGFILLVDRLVSFLGLPCQDFSLFHVWTDTPQEVIEWDEGTGTR